MFFVYIQFHRVGGEHIYMVGIYIWCWAYIDVHLSLIATIGNLSGAYCCYQLNCLKIASERYNGLFLFSLLTLDIEGLPKNKNTCSFCQSSCEKRSRFYIPRFLDMIQNLSDFQLYLQTIKSQPHHQALDLFRFS